MFEDKKDAGKKLARALHKYKNKKVLVLAIPRGGTELGFEVAKFLKADFSLLVSRKLPFPDNPESGFGAIAEDGSVYFNEHAKEWLSKEKRDEIKKQQIKEIKRRIKKLRNNKPLPKIKGRIIILVDDGIAMGSTIMAAIKLCKKQKAKKIIVASPVSGEDTVKELEKIVDEVIILEKPIYFQAVAQVYRHWEDTPDEKVLEIMKKWKNKK